MISLGEFQELYKILAKVCSVRQYNPIFPGDIDKIYHNLIL